MKGGLLSAAALVGTSALGSIARFGANDILNMGVIGTGDRGAGLIPFLNGIEGIRITACCDPLSFRLEKGLWATKNKAKGFSDYRKLLEVKDIDAVLVATPFSTHSQIYSDALETGKHVYGEKTLAKGYQGIDALVKNAQRSPKVFQTGHQYHSSRLYVHVVDLIKNGKIGKIVAFQCQWNRNGNWRRPVPSPDLERAVNWRMYKEFSGGLVAELCSHQIDFVNWVLDEMPEKVMGVGGIDYWKDGRETDDNIHLLYTYPSGVKASFTCLTSNAMDDYKIKVMGDKGTIILDYQKAWFYPEGGGAGKEIGNVDGVSGATATWEQGKGIPIELEHADPSKQALIDFADSIRTNSKPVSDILTGANTAVCVQMGLDALETGEVIHNASMGFYTS